MPSIKQRVAGFLRQISHPTGGEQENANQPKSPLADPSNGCFIQRYLNGESRLKQPDILFGRTGQELPCLRLCPLQTDIIAAHTGPDGGLTTVNRGRKGHVTSQDPDVAYIDSDDDAHVTSSSTTQAPDSCNNGQATVGRGRIGAEVMTIRAMGQTFVVRNHLPSTPHLASPPPSQQQQPPSSAIATATGVSMEPSARETPQSLPGDDEFSLADFSSAAVSSPSCTTSTSLTPTSPGSETEPPTVSLASITCADKSDDYQDFLSKFGILSLPLHPSLDRQSVVQIDSPDDTLVSGSVSPFVDQTDLALTPDVQLTTAGAGHISDVAPAASAASTADGPSETSVSMTPKSIVTDTVAPAVTETSCTDESTNHPSGDSEKDGEENKRSLEAPEAEIIEIAGVVDWHRPGGMAHGAATSLYERHPVSGATAGNPLADAFAVVARSNNALLCLADGVNWGERAALAARSAIHGAMDYLNRAFFGSAQLGRHLTTSDIFLTLLRSFHAAHSMILQEGGLLTTLTAAVVAQLDQTFPQNALYTGSAYSNSAKFAVCVCNVGDSLAYVYSPTHGVREITHGSHDVNSMRDMRDALGALGPVDGQNPELNNLTCSMTIVEEGDIVFLTSDGISDNFDPVVGKFVVARKPDKINTQLANGSKNQTNKPNHSRNLPTVEAFQRHELTLLRMEDILRNGTMPTNENGNILKAQQLCENLVDFATRLTTAKRRLLEDLELYVDEKGKPLDPEEQKIRRRKICERLALIPGKLDHATVVAYEARVQPNAVNQANRNRDTSATTPTHRNETVLRESVI